jgi:hypothetical protein
MHQQLTEQIDNLLKKIENDVRNSKTLTDINYKKNCVEVCQRTRDEMYQIQADLIEETKSKIEEALSLSEDNIVARRELFERWQMVFDSMQERCKQIGGPVQILLQNICENDIQLKQTYSSLLSPDSGGFIALLGLAIATPLLLNVCTFPAGLAVCGTSIVFILHSLKRLHSTTFKTDSIAPIEALPSDNNLYTEEIGKNFNDLLQALKTEENVWFSNDSLKRLSKSLDESEASLNLLEKNFVKC